MAIMKANSNYNYIIKNNNYDDLLEINSDHNYVIKT